MCNLMLQLISLVLAVVLLSADGSGGGSSTISPTTCYSKNNTTNAPMTINITGTYFAIGLSVVVFLFLLSLVCNCITCTVTMSQKVPVPKKEDKEDKERTQAGEEELWYTTVKFSQEANESDHMMKFDQKSEYATVVINTPDLGTPRPSRANTVEEVQDINVEG